MPSGNIYIAYFKPYQGSSTTLSVEYRKLGLGAAIVLPLENVLDNGGFRNFHVYFDNSFTSISLLKELKLRKIQTTIRKNGTPDSPLEHSKFMKKWERRKYNYVLADQEILIYSSSHKPSKRILPI
ncbi:hypothetical protein ILUMI_06506 [Ignelater luminosus]|uniref:PiggyBac transposable element-derived protein domain-containing protein n=1 Tax=Ignelater luminosus TaxID=2038154 RepID=A0A8K0GH54_IGNLU|nr:hypothetical protein ILUMI_06506 [Ignelater luminosus]